VKEKIITKVFQETEIFFEKIDEFVYLNATQTAKLFKTSKGNPKDVSEWLNSKSTKEYLLEMRKIVTPEKFGSLVITVSTGAVKERGSWIHNKLVVFFARWLSSEFAVWCDLQIEEILKSKNPETFDIKSYTQQNRDLIDLIKTITSENAITLHYLDKLTKTLNLKSPLDLLKIDLNFYYFIPTELGKFFNKSAMEVNKILEKKGFQIKVNGIWELTEQGKKYAIQLDNSYKTIKWKLESII
jgi:hypothetical protein